MSGKKLNKNGKPKNVLPEEDVNVKLKTNNMSRYYLFYSN